MTNIYDMYMATIYVMGVCVYADTLYTDMVGGGGGWVLWSGRAGKNATVKLLSSAGCSWSVENGCFLFFNTR